MIDPYKRNRPGLADSAANVIPLERDNSQDLPVGVKALRVYNPLPIVAYLVVITVVGETVSLPIPPMTLWTEPLRIVRLLEATTSTLIVHGYTDWPCPPVVS